MLSVYKQAIQELRDRLVKELGDKINSLILYGSAARGEAGEESDIDILVITRDDDRRVYDQISEIRTDVDLKNGTLTSLVAFSRAEVEKYLKLGSPFIEDVIEEGVILYDDGTFRGLRGSLTTESGESSKGS